MHTMGEREGYPLKHVKENHTLWTVRCTVSAGPVFTCDHVDATVADASGTGAYTLTLPPSAAGCKIMAQVTKRGGTSTLTQMVVGSAIHVYSTGVWAFQTYALNVSAGTIALADLVDGDVIDFFIDAPTRR